MTSLHGAFTGAEAIPVLIHIEGRVLTAVKFLI